MRGSGQRDSDSRRFRATRHGTWLATAHGIIIGYEEVQGDSIQTARCWRCRCSCCRLARRPRSRALPLTTTDGLTLIRAKAEPATHQGKQGLRVTVSDEALKQAKPGDGELNPLVVIQGLEFSNGVIEAEIAGAPAPGAGEGARGFVGIAFRMQKDTQTYDAFYLRPTNGTGRGSSAPQPLRAVHLQSCVAVASVAQGDA